MLSIASTIAPIFLLIILGYGFKRTGFPGDGIGRPAEKLAYYVLLPALIVRGLVAADLATFPMTAAALLKKTLAPGLHKARRTG